MKIFVFFFSIVVLCTTTAFSQELEEILAEAQKRFTAGDQEGAKSLYITAAEKGSAEAHFNLAYRYNTTPEEGIYHYSEAAKRGHAQALNYAIDMLVLRANSLRLSNPQRALELYEQARKANPALTLYDEENTIKLLKMCAEPKGFDAEAFIKKYKVQDGHDGAADYYVWELAEEASRGGRFGKPDPELVLNLVIRGGSVPAELKAAVEKVYSDWKNGQVEEFNICDFITSGFGAGYCAARADAEQSETRDHKLDSLKENLGDAAPLLDTAYAAAEKYIECKAENEEGHGGTGRAAWILDSENEQKNRYIELVEKIQSGFSPDAVKPLAESDQLLNEMYKRTMKELKNEKDHLVQPDQLKEVQRVWIPYRDASVELFIHLNPSVDLLVWKSWMTETRIEELKRVLEW